MHGQHSFEMLPDSGQPENESTASLLGDGEDLQKPDKRPSSTSPSAGKRPSILRSFQWEIFCFSLAAASFVSLIAIPWKRRDQQSPDWKLAGAGITLNAIISIVSTVFRSSLSFTIVQSVSQLCWAWYTHPRPLRDLCYYDSASRGPWGSLQLLVRLRFMYS